MLPRCLVKEHERVWLRYLKLEHWTYGFCFSTDTLPRPRLAIFQELYDQIFKAAERSIQKRAERAIGRRLAFLTELHYPNFFTANGGRDIPAQMIIMGGIMLNLHLRPAPQRLPQCDYCSDLSEVERTIDETIHLLDRLRVAASQVELKELLDTDSMTTEDEELLRGIKRDTADGNMGGIDKSLGRLATLINQADADSDVSEPDDPTEGLTLEELRINARVRRLVGVPPCMDIHRDVSCRCCVFDT